MAALIAEQAVENEGAEKGVEWGILSDVEMTKSEADEPVVLLGKDTEKAVALSERRTRELVKGFSEEWKMVRGFVKKAVKDFMGGENGGGGDNGSAMGRGGRDR